MNSNQTLQVLPEPAYLRRNNSGKYVTPAGDFPSVTTLLDRFDKPHLRNWYAKTTALDCLGWFQKFKAGDIDLAELETRLADWSTRMRAPEAIRDRAGNIGSLAHHALYVHAALDQEWSSDEDLTGWLVAEARGLGVLDRVEEGGNIIPAGEWEIQQLAEAACPFARSALNWVADWKPRWEVLGLEAYVVNEEFGYAGTMDSLAWVSLNIPDRLEKSRTADALRALRREATRIMAETGNESPSWYDVSTNSVLIQIDFKTSKAIRESFALQIEAYSRSEYMLVLTLEDWPEYERVTLEQRQAYKVPMLQVAASAILHVRPETEDEKVPGSHLYAYPKSDGAWHAFSSLCDVVAWHEHPDRPARVKATKPPEPPKRTTVQPFPGAPAPTNQTQLATGAAI